MHRIVWKLVSWGFSTRWTRCRYLKNSVTLIFRVIWVFVVIHQKFKTINSESRIDWKLVPGGFSIRWARCWYLKNPETLIFRVFWVFVVINGKFGTIIFVNRIGWKLVPGGFSIRWTRCRYLKNPETLLFRVFVVIHGNSKVLFWPSNWKKIGARGFFHTLSTIPIFRKFENLD